MRRRYLFDTGIAQDYQAGRAGVRERAIAERKNGHRLGICVPVLGIDMQIGAIARTLPNCVVVSKDSDLSAIPGLTVENWASYAGHAQSIFSMIVPSGIR